MQDGRQLSLAYSNTNNVYGITTDRPSFAPGCTARNLPASGSISHRVTNYINAACLTAPAVIGSDGVANGFGNTSNGIVRGPDQFDVDLSLSKSVLVNWPKDGTNVQFRTDFFNMTNHPNFAPPNLGFSTGAGSAFGTITSMSTNPRVIQFALRFGF